MRAEFVHVTLADFGRRFADWLGIEPDDPDTILHDTHRNLSRDGAAVGAGVVRDTPQGNTQIRSRLLPTRAILPSTDFDQAITELRRLILDLDHKA
jgi:hypothetical protein